MKTRFFAFAALALTLAACNNDNENLNDGPVAAKFIADITPATRVNSEGTDWTDGDCIGVTGARLHQHTLRERERSVRARG